MAENSVDFISLIKDVRGNQFDPGTGLPINGKWFDIKGWHTTVGSSAAQVATDLTATTAAKDSATTSAATATTKASDASTSATNAASSASTATAQAVVATTQAGLATTNGAAQVTLATTQAGLATTNGAAQLSLATTQASNAGASATTASTKATESASSATLAANSATAASTSKDASAASATASAASATSAATSATSATASKNAATTSEGNALTYSSTASTSATNAANSATASATSATTATTKATEAVTQRDLAADWAIAPENLAVNDGVNPSGFSSYHWAKQAQAAVGGVVKISDLSDVPALAGSANRYLRVNSGATAIEFDTLTKEDVGLTLVNNTSDANKPVSSATQSALNAKSSQAEMDTTVSRVTAVEDSTAGLSVEAAVGADPIRLLADKAIYTSATQALGSLQDAELTTFGLLKAALVAETIGTY